ncbi:MAG: adenylate/guanylate cyclase domain-containing protein, partial [Candidatus Andersenbacteria bacterium]
MLTSQTFRDLFKTESIPAENGLEFKSLTLLFTDLKGSTEMYRRLGDFKAYALVREHFALLKKLVNASGGAVVKTIGDAIMASFADPADALEAAIDMHKEISSVGMDQDLMLKIGIHAGPCIAVELNERLDYFGQTVNIAARVQGVAEAGEIVTSDSVLESPEVRALVKKAKLVDSRGAAALKGVSDNFSVHRLRPATRSSRVASTTRE